MGNCCEFFIRRNTSADTSSFLEDYQIETNGPYRSKYDQPQTPILNVKSPLKITRKDTMILYSQESPNKKISINDFEALKLLGKGSFGKVMLVEQKTSGNVQCEKPRFSFIKGKNFNFLFLLKKLLKKKLKKSNEKN